MDSNATVLFSCFLRVLVRKMISSMSFYIAGGELMGVYIKLRRQIVN